MHSTSVRVVLLALAACAASLNYAAADITGGVKQLQIGVKVRSLTVWALHGRLLA